MLPKNDFNRKMNDFDNFTKTSQTSQNFPQNVGNLGKIIVAKGFEKLPKVQKIAKFGHTDRQLQHAIINANFYLLAPNR